MSQKSNPSVAIVGRTNVGKSTLFNLLLGHRRAIVEDLPGVTRDRSYGVVTRYDFPFQLIDTGGLSGEELEHEYADLVKLQAAHAISEADVIIALFDGVAGPHPQDPEVVKTLRESDKPVIWVVNKCEKGTTIDEAVEFYNLGIGRYFCISAAHNQGIGQLLAELKQLFRHLPESEIAIEEESNEIRVALLGKPNVGKSTFVNRLLGEDRVITSPEAGTTRDSIDIVIKRDGQAYRLIDTAGLRKRANVDANTIERFSNLRTLRTIARCDVAVLLVDASLGPTTEQDAKIAGILHDRGIPFLVAVNKWDLVEKDHKSAREYKLALYDSLRFARYTPVLFISALTGKRCPSILSKAQEVFHNSQLRIPTAELNKLLQTAFTRRPPPVYRGQPLKLYFATQAATTPPTFVLFLNHPRKLHFSYQRYIKNSIRKEFPYEGTDIKLMLRKRTEKEERRLAAGNL